MKFYVDLPDVYGYIRVAMVAHPGPIDTHLWNATLIMGT